MKRKLLLMLTACLLAGVSYAQTVSVTGRVTEAGTIIPAYVSVMLKGTSVATNTDLDGNYTIRVADLNTAVLVFSGVGYTSVEIPVNGRTVIGVQISPDNTQLDEVIVTGYGGMRRSEYTGAASTVGMAKKLDMPTMSVGAKLAGATSGVHVTSTSGMPGAVESVRIRGMGSINASNQPLFVVDGVPIQAGDASGFSYSVSGNSLLGAINSADIESMTVIKDAAAASLYGSRAGNGVIIITTKKGKNGKAKFGFTASTGFSDMAINWRPTKNGPERYDLLYTSFYNYAVRTNNANPTTWATNNANTYGGEPEGGYENWKDVLFRKGNFQMYQFTVQAGNEKTKVYASLGYAQQQGITIQSGYDRYTGMINMEHREGKFFVGGSANYGVIRQQVNSEGTSYSSPLMGIAMTTTPSDRARNADGTINITTGFRAFPSPLANPLNSAEYNYDKSNIDRITSSMYAGYEIISGLVLKQTLAYDYSSTDNYVWWSPKSNDGRSSNGVFQRYMIHDHTLTSQTMLSYAKSIGANHFDALVSYEIEDFGEEYTYVNGNDYPTDKLYEISTAANTRAGGSHSANRLLSYVGRLNYNYDGRYYLAGSFRRDGTSRLASAERWGNFWSVSGSWRFMKEGFLAGLKDVITDGRIRASYGVNGVLPNNGSAYLRTFGLGYKYAGSSGMIQSGVGNEQLTWEKNYSLNVGMEILIKNRFSLNVDWYDRRTRDLIYGVPLSYTSGFSSYSANVAKMQNTGIEIDIKTINVSTKDWSWVTSLNFAHNKNKILYLSDEIANSTGPYQEVIATNQVRRVGHPYYSYYLYEYAGVDPATGKESYYVNREGREREITTVASQAQRILTGTPDPKLQGGFTNELSWKGLELNFTLTYSLGGKARDAASWLQTNGGANYTFNIAAFNDPDKMWKQPGDIAELPIYEYGYQTSYQPSTRWLLSTNHLRLKNLSLGYTLPSKWTKSISLEKVRVYMAGANLLTWKAKGMYLDPEVLIGGDVTYQTPPLKTMTFGIEIGF